MLIIWLNDKYISLSLRQEGTICTFLTKAACCRNIDIDIGTKHRLVAFKRPIIFIYFDSQQNRDCTTSIDFELYIYIYIYIYICIYIKFTEASHQYCIYIYMHIYDSKSLDVVQSLYFGSKLPSSGTYIYIYMHIYIYICVYVCIHMCIYIYIYIQTFIIPNRLAFSADT